MATATQPPRGVTTERISIRVTPAVRAHAARAATMVGQTLSAFTAGTVQEKAEAVLRDRRILELSDRDMAALLAALEDPPPNEAMLRAIARHRALIAPGDTRLG